VNDAYDTATLSAAFAKFNLQLYGVASLGALGFGWAALHRPPAKPAWFRILLFAYTAALCGANSMLLLKVIGSGLRSFVELRADLVTPLWVACLLALVGCAAVQLYFLHNTLANSPVSYGVPTYQTLLTLLTIVSGGIFFSEFAEMGSVDFGLFFVGVAIALFGVGLHTQHRRQLDDEGSQRRAASKRDGQPHSAPPPPPTCSAAGERAKLLHP